jgi:hypothetical protein
MHEIIYKIYKIGIILILLAAIDTKDLLIYLELYLNIFSKEQAVILLRYKLYNYTINLESNKKLLY